MFTYGKEGQNRRALYLVKIYGGISIASLIFSLIYEAFSHGVYSPYMMGFCLFPLIGGVCPFFLIACSKKDLMVSWIGRCAWHSAVAAWMCGSCVRGILDIYGTDSEWVLYYWGVGGVFLIISVLVLIFDRKGGKL